MFKRLDKKILKALNRYHLPYCLFPGDDDKVLKHFELDGKQVNIEYSFDMPTKMIEPQIKQDLNELLRDIDEQLTLNLQINSKIRYHQSQMPNAYINGVKNVIAIASGKGGVGKSTTAVNIAIAMAKTGAKVGLLDADIYGPSIAKMLGTEGTELSGTDKKFDPVFKHGIYSTSIAYMMDANKALVWRGPMVSNALQQLLNHTTWPELDYLFIDMPPGTGDIHLTLAQKIPVNGAVIVTTPQDIALIDAKKAISLFNKVNIPVLGLIENMSIHTCSECGHQEHLFGQGGAEKLAKFSDTPIIAQLPLDIAIREHGDNGTSLLDNSEMAIINQIYHQACLQLAGSIANQAINYASQMPPVMTN